MKKLYTYYPSVCESVDDRRLQYVLLIGLYFLKNRRKTELMEQNSRGLKEATTSTISEYIKCYLMALKSLLHDINKINYKAKFKLFENYFSEITIKIFEKTLWVFN